MVADAATMYEEVVSGLIRHAEETGSVYATYQEVVKQCHSTDRNTTEKETWWELIDNVLLPRAPTLLSDIAAVKKRNLFLTQVLENKWKVALISDNNSSERIEHLAFCLLRRAHNETCSDVLIAFKTKLAEEIAKMKTKWSTFLKETDNTQDDFYDTVFSSKKECVVVTSDRFSQLTPEMKRILVYVYQLYGSKSLGEDLFNWISDGYARWKVTDHVRDQFLTTYDLTEKLTTCSDANMESSYFFAAATSMLFELCNIHEVCHSTVKDDMEFLALNMCRLMLTNFPLYGRVVTALSELTVPYGRTQSGVDLYQRVSALPGHENIPSVIMSPTAPQNIELTKLAMNYFKNGVDIRFLESCLTGRTWCRDGPLHKKWSRWRTTWLSTARSLVFENNNKKLQYVVNDESVCSLEALLELDSVTSFFEKHKSTRNVSVEFTIPVQSTMAENDDLNEGIQHILDSLEEDDQYMYDEMYDDGFDTNTYYCQPTFPPIKVELKAAKESSDDESENGSFFMDEAEQSSTDTEAKISVLSEDDSLVDGMERLQLDEPCFRSLAEPQASCDECGRKEPSTLSRRLLVIKTNNFQRHSTSLRELQLTLNGDST